ncbi:ABC transporter ATP-binding protein [Pyramidobacter sp. SM-530-WT-4B]|uniref:ABC transporter ATP-binding protein n=1 Tax=Pyramidobacter porci TaxID=2605789 RepID=A0A6L5YCI9_9BACT|nr:ABC transporter ATP-binding protein [Pyramidobacter porci]MCI6261327.1 ABC transporter ATP-binding protein [Pyramidobacter sp.]MDY2648144.1 ABC transporter ATP-binding protein [Pyramidobacter porci]MST56056.1 ABC transporter ATP-binding protein [Pyramidobacter porci]
MNAPILEILNINKSFGGVHAVKDVSFKIEQGELAGLIGPNGAGKTTVFNLITNVYPIDSGDIIFDGLSTIRLKSYQVIRRGIARTFQNLRLFGKSTVLDNVMTAAQVHHTYGFTESITHLGRWRRREEIARRRSMEFLERVGLAGRAAQTAGTLPYGMQRRLEIARALALEPILLLLDEPAAGMNPEEVADLNKLITGIHRDLELTILVIEHHMDLIMQICPHIVCVNFGAKIAEGGPDDIRKNPEVLKAYLGDDEEAI